MKNGQQKNGKNGNGNGSKGPSANGKKNGKGNGKPPMTAGDLGKAGSTSSTHRKPQVAKGWEGPFIEKLRATGFVGMAASAVGVERTTAYDRRSKDPEFAAQWDEALKDAHKSLNEVLLGTAIRRATEGERVPVYRRARNGRMILWEERVVKSDPMLQFLMRGLDPVRFRESFRTEITGPDGRPFAPVVNATQVNISLVEDHRNVKEIATIEHSTACSVPAAKEPGPDKPANGH